MARHLDDKGKIDFVVRDDGQTIFVCTKCGKTWITNLTPLKAKLPRKSIDALSARSTPDQLKTLEKSFAKLFL